MSEHLCGVSSGKSVTVCELAVRRLPRRPRPGGPGAAGVTPCWRERRVQTGGHPEGFLTKQPALIVGFTTHAVWSFPKGTENYVHTKSRTRTCTAAAPRTATARKQPGRPSMGGGWLKSTVASPYHGMLLINKKVSRETPNLYFYIKSLPS